MARATTLMRIADKVYNIVYEYEYMAIYKHDSTPAENSKHMLSTDAFFLLSDAQLRLGHGLCEQAERETNNNKQ